MSRLTKRAEEGNLLVLDLKEMEDDKDDQGSM